MKEAKTTHRGSNKNNISMTLLKFSHDLSWCPAIICNSLKVSLVIFTCGRLCRETVMSVKYQNHCLKYHSVKKYVRLQVLSDRYFALIWH